MNAAKPTNQDAGASAPQLTQLQRRLSGWRDHQGKGRRLPQWLWDSAAEVAREEGVSRVARVLRIDFYKLKRLASVLPPQPPRAMPPPGFVELSMSPVVEPKAHCATIELSDARGRKLTIVAASELSHWIALARAFWEERE